jgi:hypothetical protein
MKKIKTWGGGDSYFKYEGSIESGTDIYCGKNPKNPINVSKEQYQKLIEHFGGQTVSIGTSRNVRPIDSVGEWLGNNVTKTAIASYVGAILIEEEFAIKFFSKRGYISFN